MCAEMYYDTFLRVMFHYGFSLWRCVGIITEQFQYFLVKLQLAR